LGRGWRHRNQAFLAFLLRCNQLPCRFLQQLFHAAKREPMHHLAWVTLLLLWLNVDSFWAFYTFLLFIHTNLSPYFDCNKSNFVKG